jgi:predicted nucleic acid-binding protein
MTINQSESKQALSHSLIREAIKKKEFFISPLILSEYIFTLSKLKILAQQSDKVELLSRMVVSTMDRKRIMEAYSLCKEIDFCKNINDVIHMKIAEEYCTKLVTFDSDFKKLQKYTEIEIEIL